MFSQARVVLDKGGIGLVFRGLTQRKCIAIPIEPAKVPLENSALITLV